MQFYYPHTNLLADGGNSGNLCILQIPDKIMKPIQYNKHLTNPYQPCEHFHVVGICFSLTISKPIDQLLHLLIRVVSGRVTDRSLVSKSHSQCIPSNSYFKPRYDVWRHAEPACRVQLLATGVGQIHMVGRLC